MKNKILTSLILFLMFSVFAFCFYKSEKSPSYKILKVVEADKFYIDINSNNKIDDDELFKLKNVNAFVPILNDYYKNEAQTLGLTIDEFMMAGYLARKYAKDNLENKYVTITSLIPDNQGYKKYRYISFNYKGSDFAKFLLKNGLGYLYSGTKDINYLQAQNIIQTKKNIKEISNLDFAILNINTNIVHKLNCEYAKEISRGELILASEINAYKPCKICFSKNEDKNELCDIPKSKKVYKNSLVITKGSLKLFLINPLLYKKPNSECKTDICREIVKEINSSKSSIDIALYGFGAQKEIFDALKNAKNRGVKIRAVVDYSKNSFEIYPETELFIKEFDAKKDSLKALMHNKFIVFDNTKVITGSSNISSSGTGGYSANSMALINSSLIAKQYKQEFEQMYNSKFSDLKVKINSNGFVEGDLKITPYFTPKGDVYDNMILPLIKNAKNEILISAFYLTDKNLINELILAKKRGVRVLVLMDALGASNFKERINQLRKEGIYVVVENWGGKNHDKTIEIDDKYLIMGSCNFSKSGFYKNDENLLLIENTMIAQSWRDYYLYLFNSIDKKYLKLFPRAEGKDSINSCHDGIDNNFDGKIDLDDEGCK